MSAAFLSSQEPAMFSLFWTLFARPLVCMRPGMSTLSALIAIVFSPPCKPLVRATSFKPEDWAQRDQRSGRTHPPRQPLWRKHQAGGQSA